MLEKIAQGSFVYRNNLTSPLKKENKVPIYNATSFHKDNSKEKQPSIVNISTDYNSNRQLNIEESSTNLSSNGLKKGYIQLGRSKQKKSSKQKNQSICSSYTQRTIMQSPPKHHINIQNQQINTVINYTPFSQRPKNICENVTIIKKSDQQPLFRKIGVLQARIQQLHLQKQQMGGQYNERMKQLQMINSKLLKENNQFIMKIKELQQHIEQREKQYKQFNYQQMLAQQITINIQLREDKLNLQKLNEENQIIKNNLQNQRASMSLQLAQIQQKMSQLLQISIQTQNLRQSLKRMQQTFVETINKKQRQILQLQQKLIDEQSKTKLLQKNKTQFQQQIKQLSQKNIELTSTIQSQKQEAKFKQSMISQSNISQSGDCHRCKQLMKTMFKLNSQLNRKSSILEDK